MSQWKIVGPAEWPEPNGPVSVFVAPEQDRTYQKAGVLRLSAEEMAELQGRVEGGARDLTGDEYNRLMEFLLEWSVQDTEALYLAELMRRKFGASSRLPRGEVPDGLER